MSGVPRTMEMKRRKNPDTAQFEDILPSATGKPSGNAMSSVKKNISTETASPPRSSCIMLQNVMSLQYESLLVNAVLAGEFGHKPLVGYFAQRGLNFIAQRRVALLEADAVSLLHHDFVEHPELAG